MLIVSDFHDYYDHAAAFGVDKTVIYHRKQETFELHHYEKMGDSWRRNYFELEVPTRVRYALQEKLVGFCGNIFPLLRVSRVEWRNDRWELVPLFITYSKEEFSSWLDTLPPLNEKSHKYSRFRKKEYRDRFFEGTHSIAQSYFVNYKTPLFLYSRQYYSWYDFNDDEGGGDVLINPCLRDLDFQKLKDAPTAFQDIFMYISGVLGVAGNPMVEISDAMKQAKHGHDGEYSFRKPPGKKSRWR